MYKSFQSDGKYNRAVEETEALPPPPPTSSRASLPPPRPQLIPRTTVDNNNSSNEDEKICRICLEEDSNETMIAPCLCKGSSKWVHRECLNLWRANEKDRAFSQCTECLFHYHFDIDESSDAERRRWRKAKFCLFVSRDVCFVTVAVQLVICLLAWIVMLIDKNNNVGVLDLFGNGCGGASSSGEESNNNFWCHHELAVYYTCGLLSLLVLLGIFGSIVLCANGCRIPDLSGDEPADHAHYQQSRESLVVTDQQHITGRSRESSLVTQQQQQQQQHTSGQRQVVSAEAERRANYYRQRRRHHHHRHNDCCECCYYCCMTDGYYGRGGFYPYYYYPYYGGGGDPCCCCSTCADADCHCPLGNHSGSGSSSGDSSSDGAHILLMILLVVVIVMAIIGFVVGVVLGVILGQRIVQRHMFLLQKRRLVDEFQVADLSPYDLSASGKIKTPAAAPLDEETPISELVPVPPPPPLHPDDALHLRKLGLLE